jgi:hypothetical protein
VVVEALVISQELLQVAPVGQVAAAMVHIILQVPVQVELVILRR